LVWEALHYERNEWDNIPGIVPKLVIYVTKYVEGIATFCKKIHDAEQVDQLRGFAEAELKKTNDTIVSNRKKDKKEKEEIKEEMKDHHEETDRFRDIYDMFVHDATHLNE
jgi:hypothetical protein